MDFITKFYDKPLKKFIFPLILAIFPLLTVSYGVDLADTGYSLATYRFFTAAESSWVMNTYLSNVLGCLFTRLPSGGTMLGMKIYSTLIISIMGLAGYRFFRTKMPAWVAFLGEMIAIGLCWCPAVILYNYMSYLFFLLGAMLLFRGLAGERPHCLVLAGILLGLNVFVRNPNILEAALICCVWYYGFLRHKTGKQVVRETLLCMAGYLGAIIAMILILMLHYGASAPLRMVGGLVAVTGSAADYSFPQMLGAIADAYLHGLKWLLYMVLCILPGIPFLMIRSEWLPRVRKALYCLGILLLFAVLWRWGMYNFRYYQKEAALQWAVIFIILALGNMIWILCTKAADIHWKLLAAIGLVVILVTPLGSNNHIWPVINNLFFAAPITLWTIYKFARWGKRYLGTESTPLPLFPLKAMQMAIGMAVLVQSIGVGCFYVFNEGEGGEDRNTVISAGTAGGRVTAGMQTTAFNARNLEEISSFMESRAEDTGAGLILYGNIPGLSYYLDIKPAISTTWPDLDSENILVLAADLDRLNREMAETGKGHPPVIINARLTAEQEENPKKKLIDEFLAENQYGEVFRNEQFIIYQ